MPAVPGSDASAELDGVCLAATTKRESAYLPVKKRTWIKGKLNRAESHSEKRGGQVDKWTSSGQPIIYRRLDTAVLLLIDGCLNIVMYDEVSAG